MPMEKAEKYGMNALDTSELIAIVLRTGQPGCPITTMTAELMRRNENKLKVLERRSRDELMTLPGIGRVKAFQIEAVLEIMRRYNREKLGDRILMKSSRDIFNYMRDIAARENVENIWLLLLNRANGLLDCKTVSKGGTTATIFDLKTILREVLITPGVEAVVMVHNHPSGNLRPSTQDDQITKMLADGCKFLGIKFVDHVIVTADHFYSYADEGRLEV